MARTQQRNHFVGLLLVLSLLAMLMTIPFLTSSFEPNQTHEINTRIFQVSELPMNPSGK
ncbi:MAG: hypothetical protein U0X58_09990 [Flavobacteriaceae bacterium]